MNTFHRVALEHEDGAIEGRGAADGIGEDGVRAGLGGDVVLLQVDGKTGVGEADVLAGWRVEGDAGPSGEVFVGAGLGLGGERADVVEGLGVGGVDGCDAFLDDVEQDDGLMG